MTIKMRNVRRRVICAMAAQVDGVMDALARYEREVGACARSAAAKARLAEARLALDDLADAVGVEALCATSAS